MLLHCVRLAVPFCSATMALKLYANEDNHRIKKILIAAAYADQKVELVADFKMGIDNKKVRFSNWLFSASWLQCSVVGIGA